MAATARHIPRPILTAEAVARARELAEDIRAYAEIEADQAAAEIAREDAEVLDVAISAYRARIPFPEAS